MTLAHIESNIILDKANSVLNKGIHTKKPAEMIKKEISIELCAEWNLRIYVVCRMTFSLLVVIVVITSFATVNGSVFVCNLNCCFVIGSANCGRKTRDRVEWERERERERK